MPEYQCLEKHIFKSCHPDNRTKRETLARSLFFCFPESFRNLFLPYFFSFTL